MGIQIDALDPTVLPNRAHEVPAMRDGQTVRLSAGQILSLLVRADLAGQLFADDIEFTSGAGLTSEDVAAALDELAARSVPAGSVIWYAANSAPPGYLKANGDAVSRSTYAALFAAIGTTFGVGDGSTTFNLPNLRGEFIRGWDDGRGVDSARAFGSAQADATDVNGLSATTTATVNAQSLQPNTGGAHDLSRGPTAGAVTLTSTDSETRPRNVALLACIKF